MDDILLIGNDDQLRKQVIFYLNTHFALKTLGSGSYFLGFEAARNWVCFDLKEVYKGSFEVCPSPMCFNLLFTK